jgi:hypothetical protein
MQTSDNEAADTCCAAAQMRHHDELREEGPGARRYSATPGLDACGVSSRGGKSQMIGHFAGHGPYMGSRRDFVN